MDDDVLNLCLKTSMNCKAIQRTLLRLTIEIESRVAKASREALATRDSISSVKRKSVVWIVLHAFEV